MKAHLDSGGELSELSVSELTPEDAACVFKQCLRDASEPLLTRDLEVSFLECAAQSPADAEHSNSLDGAVERLCAQLPAEQLANVAYTMCLLQRVHEAQTQRELMSAVGEASSSSGSSSRAMDAHNLAVVLAPNIFQCTRALFEERPSEKLKNGRSASLTRSPSFLPPRDWRSRRGRSSSQQISKSQLPPNRFLTEQNAALKRLLERFPPPPRQADSRPSSHTSLGSLKNGSSHSRQKSITKSSEDLLPTGVPSNSIEQLALHLVAFVCVHYTLSNSTRHNYMNMK